MSKTQGATSYLSITLKDLRALIGDSFGASIPVQRSWLEKIIGTSEKRVVVEESRPFNINLIDAPAVAPKNRPEFQVIES